MTGGGSVVILFIFLVVLQFYWIVQSVSHETIDVSLIAPDTRESKERINTTNNPPLKQDKTYRRYNHILLPANSCTEEQRSAIYTQLKMSNGEVNGFTCQDTDWLNSFFEEEGDIGSETFVGISVGCNKGTDAISTARMGMLNFTYDVATWKGALGLQEYYCPPQKQGNLNFPPRKGEMHCIEPTLGTYQAVLDASIELRLDAAEFVVSHAAIASRDGNVEFPNPRAGVESCGIHGCQGGTSASSLVNVSMYSLDSYVEKFVQSKGPINILNIDAEGWDFDVIFGASSVLDRTYYLEFEYHIQGLFLSTFFLGVFSNIQILSIAYDGTGKWVDFHLLDAVRLLDGKGNLVMSESFYCDCTVLFLSSLWPFPHSVKTGFTCYWTSSTHLWRITECYFDVYETWHGWSNVACVHRSYSILAKRMEDRFISTLT